MKQRLCQGGIVVSAFALLFVLLVSENASADATTNPRVQFSDLQYLGAFRVPSNTSNDFTYANDGIAYNPTNNSLFVKCIGASLGDTNQQKVAEISIPTIVNGSSIGSLNTATVRQNCADITEGHLNPQGVGNGMVIGGLLNYNNKLIGSEWAYYDNGPIQTTSHFTHSLTLNQTGTYHGQYALDAPFASYVGGQMTTIPSEWQSLLGGPALTGHCCTSIISHQSTGPSAFVFDPDQLGVQNPVPTIPLVYYNLTHPTLGTWGHPLPANPVYNIATVVTGIVFPPGTRSVLFFGITGTGEQCYGVGVSSGSNIDGIQCYDPDSSYKGTHAYPYEYYVWMYDVNDFLAVKNGTKNPWDIAPYYDGVISMPFRSSQWHLGMNGATYDPTTKRIYISLFTADNGNPIIHTFSLNTPTTPDTAPPTSPTSLSATSPSQSSISVSWTASTDDVGVTGYLVERCQGTNCTTFTQVGTPTASPFTDTGLTANTFYNYHVRATDAAGNLSGWSNVVGATTQAPDTTPPTAPSNLQTSVVSSSNITLTWTASTDTVGVTGYKLERCSGSGCTTFTEIATPTATSYSDTGLTAQTLYRYRVRATDAANNTSNYSNIAEGTTPQAPPTPTFVAEYETAWNSTASPKTTSNFSVQTGDILVAYAVNESANNVIATPPTGTLAGTWTLRQTISATDYTALRLWTMNVVTNQTNVNVTFTNSGGNFGGDVLHFRNASSVGVTAQANGASGNPTLTLNGVSENSGIVMVNGDWSARTGSRTYNTTQAGAFTETSAYADGTSYGVEAGYYANAGAAGNKNVGLTAPAGMKWALAALEVKGNPTAQPVSCNTVTTSNFSQAAYNSYGAPFDAFQTSTNLMDAKCNSADTHTINLTTGVTGDTTRIVYTKGYWYDAVTTAWRQYTGTCTGALNGEWCQGSVSATITDANVSTASASNPTYLVGMTCSVQGGSWKCGCRDTTCANFSWQIQGAGL